MISKRKSEAQRWFHQAYFDLRAGHWNIEGGFHDTACFLAQQAGEKALKSLLYYLGSRRQALLTHSLVEMVREAGKKLEQIRGLINEARQLDLHYIPSRYPNGIPSGYPHEFYTSNISKEALKAAEKIFSIIQEFFQSLGEVEIYQTERKE